jgi:hypothetical protein
MGDAGLQKNTKAPNSKSSPLWPGLRVSGLAWQHGVISGSPWKSAIDHDDRWLGLLEFATPAEAEEWTRRAREEGRR